MVYQASSIMDGTNQRVHSELDGQRDQEEMPSLVWHDDDADTKLVKCSARRTRIVALSRLFREAS